MPDRGDELLTDGFPAGFPSDRLVEAMYARAAIEKGEQPIRNIAGDWPCPSCKKLAREHPFEEHSDWLDWRGEPFLRKLCDGTRAKL